MRPISVPSKIVKAKLESADRKGEHYDFKPVMVSSDLRIPGTMLAIVHSIHFLSTQGLYGAYGG